MAIDSSRFHVKTTANADDQGNTRVDLMWGDHILTSGFGQVREDTGGPNEEADVAAVLGTFFVHP